MDIQIFGPVITVLGAIVCGGFVWQSNRSANRLSGQEILNRTMAEDNKTLRVEVKDCKGLCAKLEQQVHDERQQRIKLEYKVLELEGEARMDDIRMAQLEAQLAQKGN